MDEIDKQNSVEAVLLALQQAREYVAELYAVKNDRGYPRFSGNVSDVLDQEMRVARFLLGLGER